MAEKLFHLGVKALVTNTEGKILLLQVNTANFQDRTPHWDIPGGRMQAGQSVLDTLQREVAEETGITVVGEPEFFTAVISNIEIPLSDTEKVGLVLMVYRVTIPGNSTVHLSSEHTAYEWVARTVAAERLRHKYPAAFTDLLVV